ncbi:hypothetical protein BCR34DRAFT_494151 [Clohesyomyces aquaticus]|uniref:Zn(2)-C6 fungal-type domain-containing protein n=1 Tax=Clohesyomyces aquaticus TaxID=1231657 RepID=A0A1Y1YTH7_9PLEO|nr:hypothetical protein BCR34DRAFT_494151 [Clohesyomyces aquaticus]
MPSSQTPPERPAPLACLQCRRTHLKCAGGSPTCARCLSRGLTCTYTPSRRGCRRSTKPQSPTSESVSSQALQHYQPTETSQWISASVSEAIAPIGAVSTSSNPALDARPTLSMLLGGATAQRDEQLRSWVDDEQLVNLYYLNFHSSHPILTPRHLYWKRNYPRFLKAVVEFVGSQFSPGIANEASREATERELEGGEQNTPEMVQARILYAISLVARNDLQKSQFVLSQAVDTALQLGMNRRDFAASHANNRPSEEESLRRTWYELYITDGCIAAFQRKPTFKTNSVSADVLLPCDDNIYDDEMYLHIPSSRADYESSLFADEEVTFSSFCYRIEAVRLLGRVLAITGAHGVHRDQVQSVDNALAAFLHHLPPSKSEPEIVNTYGELDELMFQTHMVLQYATILLHFPRGDLASPVPFSTVVPGGNGAKFLCPCTRQNVHSIKAIDASKALSMLAAFRVPVQRHSPFLIYPLALGAFVQLSVSAIHLRSSRRCLDQHYDRVKLILGVLKTLGRYWPFAGVVLRSLNKMALAVFQPSRNDLPSPTQQDDPMDSEIDPCSYASTTVGSQWLENFDIQDIQGLIGLDTDGFCL